MNCKGLDLQKGRLVRIVSPHLITSSGIVAKVAMSTYGKNSHKRFLRKFEPFKRWDDYTLDELVMLEIPKGLIQRPMNLVVSKLSEELEKFTEEEINSFMVKDRKIMQIAMKEYIGIIGSQERDFWYKAYHRIKNGKAAPSDFNPEFATKNIEIISKKRYKINSE